MPFVRLLAACATLLIVLAHSGNASAATRICEWEQWHQAFSCGGDPELYQPLCVEDSPYTEEECTICASACEVGHDPPWSTGWLCWAEPPSAGCVD
jgi:hypothetical protein